MSLDPQRFSDEISEEGLGSLRGCLMDGDAEQRRRQRSIRRRSLAISIAVQSAILTALILVSLFGKPQSIAPATKAVIPSLPLRGLRFLAITRTFPLQTAGPSPIPVKVRIQWALRISNEDRINRPMALAAVGARTSVAKTRDHSHLLTLP